jgi:uncharacterized protein YutE (UPF0331/DUF86 family)
MTAEILARKIGKIAESLLSQKGVLSRDLAERMAQAGGVRNAILHEYDDIDWARVHAALTDLSRFTEFVAAIQKTGAL